MSENTGNVVAADEEFSGVFPCYEGMMQIKVDNTYTDIADLESASISIDNGVEEWNPYGQDGWTRRLMTAKSVTISCTGKRNVGDTGNDARVFTVETSGANMYAQPSYFFDIATKYLWVFYNNTSTCGSESGSYWWTGTWSNNTVSYFVVDCENESIVSEGTIVSDTNDLVPLSLPQSVAAGSEYTDFYVNACIVKDGNYVYFPIGSMSQYWQNTNSYYITGYKKINISNQAEQSTITFNSTQRAFLSATKVGGLLINAGRVVNNGVGYTCSQQLNEGNRAFSDMNSLSFLAMPIGVGNESGTRSRYLIANKLVNTTLFNLDSAVQKTTSKSMQIEYTLTEVTSNES